MYKKDPEIIVRLNSGLGNQLFQLTQGMSLAERMNARLSYDTTWFGMVSGFHPVKRQLRLPEFSVPLPEAFKGLKRLAVGVLAAFFDKTSRGRSLLCSLGRAHVIQESALDPKCNDDRKAINADRFYLNGYWQTNAPFIQVRDRLLPVLQPRNPLSSDAGALIAKAEERNSGFIHVRRGDYIHFMGESGALPVGYYSRALAKMQDAGKQVAHWMIFSEDNDWAKANLSFVPNAEIVDYQSPNRDVEDLIIMKACSAGIIANSSYSWWGAALGDHQDRPVIAPDRYWKNANYDSSRWMLPSWHAVEAW